MRRSLVVLLSVVALAAAGCDTSNPVTPPSPQDVEGVYHIAEFRFTPQASGVQPADVFARIDQGRTNLELAGSGDAIFRFALGEQPSALLAGDFTVTTTQLRLRLNDPNNRLNAILLQPPLTFNRSGEQDLVLERLATVNLAAYDPDRYAGLTAVQGTLRLRFRLGPPPAAR